MEKCRSFYLDCKQHDFGEPIEEASRLDFTDIPFIDPANDNELTRVPLSVRSRALLRRLLATFAVLKPRHAISKGLIQSLEESSINVTTYEPETDKRSRLIAQSNLFAGGSVRLPMSAPGLEAFTAELLAFPGRHDDQVDALTQGLAWGRSMWNQRVRFDRRTVS